MAQTVYAKNMNIDGMGVGVGVNWDSVDAATEKYTDDYLKSIENKIKEQGVTVSHIEVLGIDPAVEILELEKSKMITAPALAFGHAEKVLRKARMPPQ
jgi:hypothetical protein